MSYTLGTASSPNVTWGAYYNDMGVIQEESCSKKADLSPEPLIGSNSNETDVYEGGGCVREITVTFIKTGAFTALATFAQALQTLINGDQEPPSYPILFASDVYGSVYVKIQQITSSMRILETGTTSIVYTLQMIESSQIG